MYCFRSILKINEKLFFSHIRLEIRRYVAEDIISIEHVCQTGTIVYRICMYFQLVRHQRPSNVVL